MGGTGFPTLMFLDAEGRRLLKHDGPRTIGGFEDALTKVQEFLALEKKAAGGDAAAATDVFLRKLRLGWLELEEARKLAGELEKVTPKQRAELDQLLVDLEVRDLAQGAKARDARLLAGERFAAMWEDKQVPEGESELYSFWTLMADHAEAVKDKKLFKKIVSAFEDTLPKTAAHRSSLKELEGRLKSFPK